MANLEDYPASVKSMFTNTEVMSEALWMEERWVGLSNTANKNVLAPFMVNGVLGADDPRLRTFWLLCLATYRAVRKEDAHFVRMQWKAKLDGTRWNYWVEPLLSTVLFPQEGINRIEARRDEIMRQYGRIGYTVDRAIFFY